MIHPEHVDVSAVIASISPEEKAVRRAFFDAILSHAQASPEILSQQTGLALTAVANAIERLLDLGLVVCDDTGSVVGSWGLTLVPTSHRLHLSGREYYTWCAEDAVGIPAALRADASIVSSCFQCGREVSVEMRSGEVVSASPEDVRLWIAEAEVGRSVVGNT